MHNIILHVMEHVMKRVVKPSKEVRYTLLVFVPEQAISLCDIIQFCTGLNDILIIDQQIQVASTKEESSH